jgi:hypothetical protein
MTMHQEISNGMGIIDSRDIISRIDELEAMEGSLNQDDLKELQTLKAFSSEASQYCEDWKYGATIVNESYFTIYIQEFIHDCYELPDEFKSNKWPFRHMKIDYEAAASEAKQDYTEVDFDGVTYLVR